jgi:serine/threonine protein kinase
MQAAAIGATAIIPLSVQLDELSLLGELASGAEATVLYGSFCGQDVAVKRFKISQSDDLIRFRRELSILASLAGHPNIVPVVAARALPPDYLLVMPLAATTVHAKLYQMGWRPSTVELLQLSLQAAEALTAVHAAGLVHRDLKPSNMLLTGDFCGKQQSVAGISSQWWATAVLTRATLCALVAQLCLLTFAQTNVSHGCRRSK